MAYIIVAKVCPSCQYENDSEARYCTQCATALDDSTNETTLRVADLPIDQAAQLKYLSNQRAQSIEGAIVLFIDSDPQPVVIKDRRRVIIGRGAPGSPPPTVDMNDYKGYALGVSRRHAVITHSQEGYAIIDLGSTNGTWLNHQMLKANKSYLLHNGDRIQLGQLVVSVYF